MPIRKEEARAVCQDCQEEITGSITINVANWAVPTPVNLAEGQLAYACAVHHNEERKWGQEDLPKHSEFTVFEGEKVLGKMRVATAVREQQIIIEDRGTLIELQEERRRLRREYGY